MIFDLGRLPSPAGKRLAVRVTPAAQAALRGGHPWVFDQSIVSVGGKPEPQAGDLAVIFDDYRRFLAVGLYDPHSPLRIRVLQHRERASIGRAWFRERLAAAAALRASLPDTDTDAYRLVHGENDGLPGLVVDRYADHLVLKLYTAAWLPWLPPLLDALLEVQPAATVVLRLSRETAVAPGLPRGLTDGVALAGKAPSGPVAFRENGLRFAADLARGQKTGFFLDQRDNRSRVEKLARGRRTLNVFAYTGGFSLYAARGGAPEVLSIDLSEPALRNAAANFALNRDIPAVAACRHSTLAGDAFELLAQLGRGRARFGLVVVDPPAFAKRASEAPAALRAYTRLTELALKVTAPGGVVALASCSSRVPADEFFATVTQAAVAAGRPLREIERTGHPLDHPTTFAEAAYLKCLFATVA
jgi:23S rRNA (cytosine1962-C5)-methyltransferase